MRTTVVIGASNVTLSLPLIWSGCCAAATSSRVIAVAGHGRSFGLPSTVLGRTLPSILQCGFWTALDQLTDADELGVLITDVGNDILYGASPGQIDAWVRECVERIRPRATQLAITELPLGSLATLSRTRFMGFRSVLFPSSRLKYEDAISRGAEVNSAVRQVAIEFGGTLLTPQPDWYGFDPIHVRRKHRRDAWTQYLQPLIQNIDCRRVPPRQSLRIWKLRPARRWLLGREQQTSQPALQQAGSELWLF